MKMKDLDLMSIEQLIRLPFFHALQRHMPGTDKNVTEYWKITFKCNRMTANGEWQLLDHIYETEYIQLLKLKEI